MTLPTDIVAGQSGHAAIHNNVNAAVNGFIPRDTDGEVVPDKAVRFMLDANGELDDIVITGV